MVALKVVSWDNVKAEKTVDLRAEKMVEMKAEKKVDL